MTVVALIAVVAAVTPAAAGTPAAPAAQTETSGTTSSITRALVIARALSWVTQGVPYSQTAWWTDGNGRYRQDCSGYVAMAWGLDQRTNYWTGNLATVSERIAPSAMQAGDILLLPGEHTVIFAGWTDSSRTRFTLYEQYRPGYEARHVAGASLASYLAQGYGAYRYSGLAGASA